MVLESNIEPQSMDERNWTSWSWCYLRTEFREQNLENLFHLYVQKIQHGYFSLFLILQIFISVTHIVVLLTMRNFDLLFPDLMCYCIIAVLSLLALFMKESLGKTSFMFPLIVTIITILLLITTDLLVPIYHSTNNLRPAYTTHIIIACYIFLPIPDNLQAFVFGFAVTLCHLVTLGTVTYRQSSDVINRLGCDAIYMLCINGMGLYFRFLNEILKRRTFLDRRACVESTFQLEHERDQEEQLMLSILPQHIAKQVREDIKNLQNLEMGFIPEYKPFSKLYIEKHDDVTILYADIVRYTQMTRQLPVIKLVETLNELFGKFDDASEEHGVLRIKFLGDCYYCVSGIPDKTSTHALDCVELGLDMITIIQAVRRKRNLDIDMRIGVHSGSILGGIIGECKWQYDIWSQDVDIANRMETKGHPGKVHVTYQTLQLLNGKYPYEISNAAAEDDFLKRLNIKTFLISPAQINTTQRVENRARPSTSNGKYIRRQSANTNRNYVRPITTHTTDGTAVLSHRRTAFINHHVKRYHQHLNEIGNRLEEAIENLPLGKFEQWFRSPGINPLFLTFKNWKLEFPYFVLPDPIFKYYLLSSLCVLIAVLAIQEITLFQWDWSIWLILITLALLFIFLIPLAWFHTIFRKLNSVNKVFQRRNSVLTGFRNVYKLIESNTLIRVLAYFTVSSMIAACAIVDLVEFEHLIIENKENNFTCDYKNKYELYCIVPWHATQTCSLAIIASFLFLRIHLGMKLIFGSAVTCIFSYFMWNLKFTSSFGGESWNPDIKPQIACIMSITFLTFTLHLIDRQAEYMNRLDYQWQTQLTTEQKEAQTMHRINNLLLCNILPIHVAQIYLDTNRQVDELYHEPYKSVAVMFASVVDRNWETVNEDDAIFNKEKMSIKIMNQIICEFDKLLMEPCGQKIEKIKVTGWTYMAACGLNPGRKDSTTSVHRKSGENIVVQLLRFGTNMMRVLNDINKSNYQEFKLRIGISHGEVTAGVVGSKKPLYDIWGNAVNMASRMDSTGEKGMIQVTENTAQILQKQGIKCTYRGEIWMKGLEIHLPTYFVNIDALINR